MRIMVQRVAGALTGLLRDAAGASMTLYKLMIPAIIAVKVLKEAGGVDFLGDLLSPVMQIVGLPGEMGLVWATAMLTSLYAGIMVLAAICGDVSLTVAQMTVIASLMLVAHALPVELRIAQQAGSRVLFMTGMRLIGAFAYGSLLDSIYKWGGWLQEPCVLNWIPQSADPGLLAWTVTQLKSLVLIFVMITILMAALKTLKWLKITDLLIRLLSPLLRPLGIGGSAITMTIIGMTLGIGYGGGLIINEARSGGIDTRDVFFSMTLMGLMHSIFEDTAVMALIGGALSGILWGRLAFAVVFTFLLAKMLPVLSENAVHRYFFRKSIAG